ncbi:MAG: membrane protein insertase YidC [bacterium]
MDRNFLIAVSLSLLVFVTWDIFIQRPQQAALQAQIEAREAEEVAQPAIADDLASQTAQSKPLTREEALARAPARIPIETPSLTGSINLRGVQLDDLKLKNYKEGLEESSPLVTLLSPFEADHGYYLQNGIVANGQLYNRDVWQAEDGAKLTPDSPVTLTLKKDGFIFHQTISVDDKFMFTVEQRVTNETGGPALLSTYGLAVQKDLPPDLKNMMILQEGPVGVIGGTLYQRKYKNVFKKGDIEAHGKGGWVGLTGKYWLGAAIAPLDAEIDGKLKGLQQNDHDIYRASYALTPESVKAGDSYMTTSHLFAGAKEVKILREYEAPIEKGGLGIVDFDKAVDWGHFFFLTRPIFNLMEFLFHLVGNYGVAILLLTVIIKLLLLPIANMGFASMANMKKVQPEMTAMREKYKDDNMKLQQEMMALYKKHNINPMLGCLPLVIQMPVFYALYKVLFVTIESRHEAFLYIKDLSAKDPTNLFNLFGLLPYDPTSLPIIGGFLAIGILPLLMGIAMFVQMKLNPPPPDPVQAQVFGLMPFFFVFIFAPFSAGLVLYWFWNTFLGIIQQYFIMKRHGADVDILGNIKNSLPGRNSSNASNDNK